MSIPVPHLGALMGVSDTALDEDEKGRHSVTTPGGTAKSTPPTLPDQGAPGQTIPAAGGPCACELLTALIRVRRLLDRHIADAPDDLAADDIVEALGQLRDEMDAAGRAAAPIRDAGLQAERACADDLRRSTRLTLQLDLIHDVAPAELEATVLARLEQVLAGDDIDVAEVTSTSEPRPLG